MCDFNYVKDIVNGFIVVFEFEYGFGEVVNFGSNFEIFIGDMVWLIVEVVGKEFVIIIDEDCFCFDVFEVECLWVDNVKVKELFGWELVYGGRDGFKCGLSEMIEWFKCVENFGGYKVDCYNI